MIQVLNECNLERNRCDNSVTNGVIRWTHQKENKQSRKQKSQIKEKKL